MSRLLMSTAVIALLAAIAGCMAYVPMAPTDDDAAGKRFDPPPPGQASIYVFREGGFGAAQLITASIGQRTIGQVGADTWFRVDVDAVPQQIRCTTPEAAEAVEIQPAPGETRFVEIGVRVGWAAARCAISEVPAEKGRAAVRTGRRALTQ